MQEVESNEKNKVSESKESDDEHIKDYQEIYGGEGSDCFGGIDLQHLQPLSKFVKIEIYVNIDPSSSDKITLTMELDEETKIFEVIKKAVQNINDNDYEVKNNKDCFIVELEENPSRYKLFQSKKNKTPKDLPPFADDIMLKDTGGSRFCLVFDKDVLLFKPNGNVKNDGKNQKSCVVF